MAYAGINIQSVIDVTVPPGSTVLEAIEKSELCCIHSEIELARATIGIFGKIIKEPSTMPVYSGQRIEIYRDLLVDPKERRRIRARY